MWKSADQAITSEIRQQTPSFNKDAATWGTKPDASLTAAYYLKGSFNGWAASAEWALSLEAGETDVYSIAGVNLPAGAKLKVWARQGQTQWYSSASTWDNCGFTIDGEGNIVVTEQGVYTVGLDLSPAGQGNYVYLTKASA